MVQDKDVSADIGAAAIRLSLTFTNLEEVHTERRGKEKNQKKKKKKHTNTYTHKNIYGAGASSRIEKEGKTQCTQVLTTEHSWIFLLNQMAEKDLMLTLEVVCIRVQPSHPIKASMGISHAIACQSILSNQKCNRWQRCIIPQLEVFLPHPLKQRKTRLKKS